MRFVRLGLNLCLFVCLISCLCVPARAAEVSVTGDSRVVQQVLDILKDAVITRVDGQVSLEKLVAKKARVRLNNLVLRNLDVGLRLNARGAQRLATLVDEQSSNDSLKPILEIARLGLFNKIELSVRLRELRVRYLGVDADDLNLEGLLLQVGATPNDPVTGRPRSDTLAQVLHILRNTALNRIQAHAGLDELTARRIRLDIQGVSLESFGVTVALIREDRAST
jgi:hypothetical protein